MRRFARQIMALLVAGICIPVTGLGAAQGSNQVIEERRFRLPKRGEDLAVFTLTEPATIVVDLRIKTPLATIPMRLVLEGPDGLQVDKQGAAPLRLRHTVIELHGPQTWRAVVLNTSNLGPVAGRMTIEIEPVNHGNASAAVARSKPDAGTVRFIDDQKIRAVCRDENTDVFVRLDMERHTGVFFMSFNPVFNLEATYIADRVIEMRGDGEHPLYLDLERRLLYFASGEPATFCQVRLHFDERR